MHYFDEVIKCHTLAYTWSIECLALQIREFSYITNTIFGAYVYKSNIPKQPNCIKRLLKFFAQSFLGCHFGSHVFLTLALHLFYSLATIRLVQFFVCTMFSGILSDMKQQIFVPSLVISLNPSSNCVVF